MTKERFSCSLNKHETSVFFSDLLSMDGGGDTTPRKNAIKESDPAFVKLSKRGGHASKSFSY